jgi:hypothetical protein
MEKGQKPEPGKQNDQRKFQLSIEVLRDSSCCIFSPWAKFEELAISVAHLSRIDIFGPLKNYSEKRQIGPS